MINPLDVENHMVLPGPDDRKPKHVMAFCIECGEAIVRDPYGCYDWESEYIDTIDGPCHAECATQYFQTYIDLNKKVAR